MQGKVVFESAGDRLLFGRSDRAGAVKALLLFGAATVVALCWVYDIGSSAAGVLQCFPIGRLFTQILCGYAVLALGVLMFRAVLVVSYRPAAPVDDDELPRVSVIVPAYNEGRFAAETLQSVLRSDYPSGKLEIIAVDDGSQDDTWYWMRQAAAEAGGRIKLIRSPENRGKRHALWLGFSQASGEVFVTVDSDSLIDVRSLREVVSPIVRDRRVGAVAGSVWVMPPRRGWIAHLMNIAYTVSFEFGRAYQSRLGAVMCTPGALSAYRRRAVMPVLDRWLNQRFAGRRCMIGEDRSLTNMVMQRGYRSVFQSTARVYTAVPRTHRQLRRMFLRWARSGVRESLLFARYAFRRVPRPPTWPVRINFAMIMLGAVMPYVLLAGIVAAVLWQPIIFAPKLIYGISLGSLIPAGIYYLRRRDSDWVYAIAYSFYWTLWLTWVMPHAALTPFNDDWLTKAGSSSPQPTGPHPEKRPLVAARTSA